jgi:ABC-type transporter Mla subunit MlaD
MPGRAVFMAPADDVALLAAELALLEAELADELADLDAELADLEAELADLLSEELMLLAAELADEETLEAEDEAEPVRLLRTEPWGVSVRGRFRRLSDRESYLGRR